MKQNLINYLHRKRGTIAKWSSDHLIELFVFNIFLMLLIMLHSAGYFQPYLPLTLNLIFFVSLVFAIVFLDCRSKTIFFIAMLFWIFAMILRIANLEIWAERTAIYTYEAICVGVLLLFLERTPILS